MPTSTARPGLAGLVLTDPQHDRAWQHAVVPAVSAAELPAVDRDLDVDVVGAGRTRGLEEWVAETSSTSLLVLDQGTVVHEWYADGLGADTRFLGASMTKSVLAHLVGRAVRDGALALTDAVSGHVQELAGSGYDGTTVVDLLTMTTGVDWVEDHRDPDSLASRLVACFATGSDSRALLRQTYVPACRRAPGSPTARPTRRCWTGCASGPPAAPTPTTSRACGRHSAAPVTRTSPSTVRASRWRAVASPRRHATGPGWPSSPWTAATREASGCSKVTGSRRPPVRRTRSSPSAGCRAASPRTPASATTGGRWTTRGHRVTADGSRGQFACADRRTGAVVVKTSQWPYDDFLVDRQARDLSYLGLHALLDAVGTHHQTKEQTP